MEKLLEQLQRQAEMYHDGHFTILKFTTHYKCSFGTITEREDIDKLTPFKTLKDAIVNCILNDLDYV